MHRLVRAVAATACSVLAISCGAAPTTPTAAPAKAASVPPPPADPVASTLTFSIDSACRAQFPQAVQQRSYAATLQSYATPTGAAYDGGTLTLAGATFRTDPGGYEWRVVYRSTKDGTTTYWFDEPPIWEWLGADAFVVIDGRSTYQGASPYGEWAFSGTVFYCASTTPTGCAVPEVSCQSDHHRLRVTQALPAAG